MKVFLTSALLFLSGLAWSSLEAASYCRVQHPDFYYQSQGRRHHGRYGAHHFRHYHPVKRAYPSHQRYYNGKRYYNDKRHYRDNYRRGRLYRGRRVHRPYVYSPRYYRRPGLSFHYQHRGRYGKGPRFGIHLDF